MAEPKTATALELERAKALSEEARKVLSDLNMGTPLTPLILVQTETRTLNHAVK
jgi:hypothetical protein